jgi:DNA-binding CsgD family transcriptional regulator
MAKRGRPPHPDVLTPREWEVLGAIRDGLSNEEIADRLGISIDGAKYHVTEILTKLGLENRHDAALWRPGDRRPWWDAALLFWPRWLSPVVAGALAVAVAAGAGVLVWALVATRGGELTEAGLVPTATATATAIVTSTPSPAPTEAVATELLPTEPPPTAVPTPDTRVAIRELPLADQILLGQDGKYFLADRGDGCRWVEVFRVNDTPEIGDEVILRTDCPVDFQIAFRPASREVLAMVS